jgi:Glycosyl transferases group 1
VSKSLRRIVLMATDLSTLGGIQLRIAKTLRRSAGRSVSYVGLSLKWEQSGNHNKDIAPNILVFDRDREAVLAALQQWSPDDTSIVFPNNTLKAIDPELRSALDRFPLIFIGSGQLTYHLQDSEAMVDGAYWSGLKVTKLVVLSKLDSFIYGQFGNSETTLGFNPVETRAVNTYDLTRNNRIGYVGRLDFRTKGGDRLLDICRAVRDAGRGPFYVYTVSNRQNSPDIDRFRELVEGSGLANDFRIILDETDLDTLFGSLQVVFLPSRKESFGNTILEAYSYGVPVVSAAHAPGPATLIDDGQTGLLLDRFDHGTVLKVLHSLSPEVLTGMSGKAFIKHNAYGMEHYFDHLEQVAAEAVTEFSGSNTLNVFPTLAPVEWYRRRTERLEEKLARRPAAPELSLWERALRSLRARRRRLYFAVVSPIAIARRNLLTRLNLPTGAPAAADVPKSDGVVSE